MLDRPKHRPFFWLGLVLLTLTMTPTRASATPSMSPEAQRVDLDFTSEDSATQSHDTLRDLPISTTSISIKGYGSLLNISTLDDALEHLLLPLEEFHFDMTIPIPISTLSVIETFHDQTRLYYHMFFSRWDPYDRNVPSIQISGVEPLHSYRNQMRRGIIGSQNLYALKASILYGGHDNHEDLSLVHDILKSCPNIRELDLSIDHAGCVVANYPYAFDFTKEASSFSRFSLRDMSTILLKPREAKRAATCDPMPGPEPTTTIAPCFEAIVTYTISIVYHNHRCSIRKEQRYYSASLADVGHRPSLN